MRYGVRREDREIWVAGPIAFVGGREDPALTSDPRRAWSGATHELAAALAAAVQQAIGGNWAVVWLEEVNE